MFAHEPLFHFLEGLLTDLSRLNRLFLSDGFGQQFLFGLLRRAVQRHQLGRRPIVSLLLELVDSQSWILLLQSQSRCAWAFRPIVAPRTD